MKDKKRFVRLIGFAFYLIIPALLVTWIFLHQLEQKYEAIALTSLDAQAGIQKARIQDMIESYYQRILSITSREALKRHLEDFWEYGDVEQIIQMKKILPNVKQPYSDFKEIFIFDREGAAVTSTQETIRYKIPVSEHVLREGHKRLTVTFFESQSVSNGTSMELLLMGPVFSKGKLIGGVGIVADNETLTNIAGDLSGLGKTGKICVAKKNERGDAEIIVGGERFSTHPGTMANIPQHELSNPMTQALFRYEGVLTHAVDERNRPIFAATRFIPEEDWGVVVQVDKNEVLRPIQELRRLACSLVAVLLVFWTATGFLWLK